MSPGKIAPEYIALDCKVVALQIDPRGIVLSNTKNRSQTSSFRYIYVMYLMGILHGKKKVWREIQHNVNIISESCYFIFRTKC